MLKHLRFVFVFICCLMVAVVVAPASESVNTRGTAGLSPDSPVTLTLVRREKTGESEMADGETLTKNDSYAVTFHAEQGGYVYVFQIDAKNNMFPLFPNGKYCGEDNPVKPGATCRIPDKGKWLFLDNNAGTEEIILLAHPKPVENPKKICENILFGSRKVGGFRDKLPYDDMIVIRRHFIHK